MRGFCPNSQFVPSTTSLKYQSCLPQETQIQNRTHCEKQYRLKGKFFSCSSFLLYLGKMEEKWSDKQQDQNNKNDNNNTAQLWTVK